MSGRSREDTVPVPALHAAQEALLNSILAASPQMLRSCAALFAPPPSGTIKHRFWIYSEGIVVRRAEALENDYPAIRRILGEGPFRSLAARYARAHPSTFFDLGRAGGALPRFLVSDPLTEELPFLPDLARLERAIACAFVAADAEPRSWEELARLSPAEVADLSLKLLPGTALLSSRWPLLELRACSELPDDQVAIPVAGRPGRVVVYRRGLEVRSVAASAEDLRFLRCFRQRRSLAAIAPRWGETETAHLAELFRRWASEGVLQVSSDRA